MADLEFPPNRVPVFGGLCTLIERGELPLGLSPNCSDVKFVPGAVGTRDGYTLYWTDYGKEDPVFTAAGWQVPTDARIAGIGGYISPDGTRKRLFYFNHGVLVSETPEGTTTAIVGPGCAVPGKVMQAAQAFNRAYLAFSDGLRSARGSAQFDDAGRLYSVASEGPGVQPLVTAYPAGGTIEAGTRRIACAFRFRDGSLSPLSPYPNLDVSPGGTKMSLSVPVGPPNVVARYIFITAANGATMYCITSKMVIADNTTVFLTNLNFTDAELTSSQLTADNLTARAVVGGCVGSRLLGNRLARWGVDRCDAVSTGGQSQGIPNPFLRGGQADFAVPMIPAGWAGGTTGSAMVNSSPTPPFWGPAYAITNDGTGVPTGLITSGNLAPGPTVAPVALQFGATYTLEAWVRKVESVASPLAAASVLQINAYSKRAAGTTLLVSLQVDPTSFPAGDGAWHRVTADAGVALTADAYDITLQVSQVLPGSSPAGTGWQFGGARVYPQGQPIYDSEVWVSDPYFPDQVSAASGIVSVAPGNGQKVTNVFPVRNFYYIAKERSLYVTNDTGDTPSNWPVDVVSDVVGTPSNHGVVIGDGFAVIAGRAGAYMLVGGAPQKLSQEIEPTWRTIDWSNGHTLFCVLDEYKKLLKISAPMIDGTRQMFVLDYVEGWGDPISGAGRGRKWSIEPADRWLCGASVERDNKQLAPMYGGGVLSTLNPVARSQTFDAANWTSSGGADPVRTAGQLDSRGGSTATRWVFAGARTMTWQTTQACLAGEYRTFAIALKGTASATVQVVAGGQTWTPTTVVMTGNWQRATFIAGPFAAPVAALAFALAFPAGTFYVNDLIAFGDQYDLGWAPSGTTTGWVATPDSTAVSDFYSAIGTVYETAPLGDEIGRSLFTKVIVRARGNGTLLGNYVQPDGNLKPLQSAPLAAAPLNDIELGASATQTQMGIRLATTAYNSWFVMRRLCALIARSAFGWTRGHIS